LSLIEVGFIIQQEVAMNLSAEQVQAIKDGEPVRLVSPEVGEECVVLRADVFDRVKRLSYDDSPWTDEELRNTAARTFDDADSAGPI
jgi:hypothetical protein